MQAKAQSSTETVNLFINDLPQVVKNNELVVGNQTLTQEIDTGLLRTTDSDNGAETFTYTVTSEPGQGVLLVNGKSNTSFTQENIDSGNVEYKFTGSSNATEDSFKFRVADADGGKTGQQTFNIRINQPPEVESSRLNVIVGTRDNIGSANLDATDPDVNNAPDSSFVYELAAQGTSGKVQLNNKTLAVGETFTQEDINQGNVSYLHTAEGTGSDFFSYLVSDSDGGVTTGKLAINITPPNVAPVAEDDIFETDSGAELTIADDELLANDSDADAGDTISIVDFSTEETQGTVQRDGNQFIYTPPSADFIGQDSFTYTIEDTKGVTDTATVFVSVAVPANEPPVAEDDSFETEEGTQLTIATSELLVNDSDADEGDEISIVSFSAQNTEGSVRQQGENFIYTPAEDFIGEDTFTYTIEDNRGETDTATVTVNVVLPPNEPPVAEDDSFETEEGTQLTIATSELLVNDSDADEDDEISIVSFSAKNTEGSVRQQGENFIYTPAEDFTGEDTFTYTIEDTKGVTDTATVFVSVAVPANEPPVAEDDSFETEEGTQLTIATSELLANDSDADEGDEISIVSFSAKNTEGSVRQQGENFIYTPAEDFTGEDTFTYTIEDNRGETDTATVTVNVVLPPNEPPVAEDDSFETEEGTQLTIATSELLVNDSDADEDDEISIVSFSAKNTEGSVRQQGENFIYTPAEDFIGEDTFTYTIEDNRGETDTATVTVNVLAVATPPTLEVTDSASGTEDDDVALDIQASLTGDDESETLSITIADVPDTATLSAGTNNGDGSWTLTAAQLENLTLSTPQDGQDGTTNFTLTVTATVTDSDSGDTASESATIDVAVDALNDAPVLTEDSFQLDTINENVTNSNGSLVSDLIADSVTDADADAVQGIAVTRTDSKNGTWQYSTDGGDTWVDFDSVSNTSATVLTATDSDRLRFVPDTDFAGDATLRFRAWDTTSGETSGTTGVDASTNGDTTAFSSDVGVATITVNDVPAVTTNSELVVNTQELGSIVQSLLETTDSDNGEDTFTYRVLTEPSRGQLLLDGEAASKFTQEDIDSGLVTYEHTANNTNDDSFVFRVLDVDGGSTQATFNIRVNDPPEGTTSDLSVLIGETGEIGSSNLSYSDPDVADAPANSLTYTLTELPTDGNLQRNGENLAVGDEFSQANINNGALAYENTLAAEATDSFSFTVSDSDGGTTTGSFNIEVIQANRAPIVDASTNVELLEDETRSLQISAPTDPDGDDLTVTVDTIPDADKGEVQLANGNAVTAGQELTPAQLTGLTFVPAANENGAAGDFSYSVFDGNDENNSATQTITLDITPVDDPPVAVDDG